MKQARTECDKTPAAGWAVYNDYLSNKAELARRLQSDRRQFDTKANVAIRVRQLRKMIADYEAKFGAS